MLNCVDFFLILHKYWILSTWSSILFGSYNHKRNTFHFISERERCEFLARNDNLIIRAYFIVNLKKIRIWKDNEFQQLNVNNSHDVRRMNNKKMCCEIKNSIVNSLFAFTLHFNINHCILHNLAKWILFLINGLQKWHILKIHISCIPAICVCTRIYCIYKNSFGHKIVSFVDEIYIRTSNITLYAARYTFTNFW